jgi:hypothetical protein
MLAFFQGSLFVPAFNGDFNRSVIFLTILMGVLLYSEDFEVIIAFSLIEPIIIYAVAAVVSIFQSDDAFFGFVGTITVAMSYFFIAGMGALCIGVTSGWLANKFRVVRNTRQNGNEGVFKVINSPIKTNKIPDLVPIKIHTSKQMFGIIVIEIIGLMKKLRLLFLPMYDYSTESHLYIADLGLLQMILLFFVSLNAIILISTVSSQLKKY